MTVLCIPDELLLQENRMLAAYLNRLHPSLGDVDASTLTDATGGATVTASNGHLASLGLLDMPEDDGKRYQNHRMIMTEFIQRCCCDKSCRLSEF